MYIYTTTVSSQLLLSITSLPHILFTFKQWVRDYLTSIPNRKWCRGYLHNTCYVLDKHFRSHVMKLSLSKRWIIWPDFGCLIILTLAATRQNSSLNSHVFVAHLICTSRDVYRTMSTPINLNAVYSLITMIYLLSCKLLRLDCSINNIKADCHYEAAASWWGNAKGSHSL